jgi:hypothetical protein
VAPTAPAVTVKTIVISLVESDGSKVDYNLSVSLVPPKHVASGVLALELSDGTTQMYTIKV